MPVPDCNVFVATYKTNDIFHVRSRDWVARYLVSSETLHAPYLLLSELAGAIARPTHDPVAAHAAVSRIQLVPRLTLHPVDRAMSTRAAQLAADFGLRGADAVYAAVAMHWR